MPRDVRDREGPFKWRVLTPSRTWEFTNETDEEMKGWVRMIARIVNPELTFGMPLSTVVARCKRRGSPTPVPLIVITLIQFLRDNDAANVEGVFRMSGDQNSIKQLKSRFNTEPDNTIVIHRDTDIHVVTGTLKYFLRELESALIPVESNTFLRAILGLPSVTQKVVGYRKLFETLPVENSATLQYILKYLSQIASASSVNLMTTQNLAVVFGPCFIRPEPGAAAFEAADMQLNCVNTLVEQYSQIFPNEDLIATANSVQPPTFSSGAGLSTFNAALGTSGGSGIGAAALNSSGGANQGNAPPLSSPPSFLPPPPNRNPPAPVIPGGGSPAAPSLTFRTAGPGIGSRENGIIIGSGSSGSPGPAVPGGAPPSHVPPSPSTSTDSDRPLNVSRPPAFAPPTAPSGSPLNGSSNNTDPISVPTSSSVSPPDSTGVTPSTSFVSIYDSSSDEELDELVNGVMPRATIEEDTIYVTSLDDLEGEDGSIDVSKIFPKNAAVNINMNNRGRTWTSSKPTGAAAGTPPPAGPPPAVVLPTATIVSSPPVISPPTAVAPPTAAPVAPTTTTAPAATSTPSSLSSSAASIPADAGLAAIASPQQDEIRTWLSVLGDDYLPYAAILNAEGFKTTKQLADITDDDMKELGIKMAHRKAMRAAIDKI